MLETDRFSWVLLLRLVRLDQGASRVVLVVKNPLPMQEIQEMQV